MNGMAIEYIPNDGRLDNVLPVLVDGLPDVSRFRLLLGFDGRVQVDTDLLRLEVCVD